MPIVCLQKACYGYVDNHTWLAHLFSFPQVCSLLRITGLLLTPFFPQTLTRFGFYFHDGFISHISYPTSFQLGHSSLLSCPQWYHISVPGLSHLLIFTPDRCPQIFVQLSFSFWFEFTHKPFCSKPPMHIRIIFSLQHSLYPSALFLSISTLMI